MGSLAGRRPSMTLRRDSKLTGETSFLVPVVLLDSPFTVPGVVCGRGGQREGG